MAGLITKQRRAPSRSDASSTLSPSLSSRLRLNLERPNSSSLTLVPRPPSLPLVRLQVFLRLDLRVVQTPSRVPQHRQHARYRRQQTASQSGLGGGVPACLDGPRAEGLAAEVDGGPTTTKRGEGLRNKRERSLRPRRNERREQLTFSPQRSRSSGSSAMRTARRGTRGW